MVSEAFLEVDFLEEWEVLHNDDFIYFDASVLQSQERVELRTQVRQRTAQLADDGLQCWMREMPKLLNLHVSDDLIQGHFSAPVGVVHIENHACFVRVFSTHQPIYGLLELLFFGCCCCLLFVGLVYNLSLVLKEPNELLSIAPFWLQLLYPLGRIQLQNLPPKSLCVVVAQSGALHQYRKEHFFSRALSVPLLDD